MYYLLSYGRGQRKQIVQNQPFINEVPKVIDMDV